MKAMSSGCVPITSKFGASTLPELTGEFDLGVEMDWKGGGDDEALFGFSMREVGEWPVGLDGWIDTYVNSIVEAKEKSNDNLDDLREVMKRQSRERFDWDNVAQIWDGQF